MTEAHDRYVYVIEDVVGNPFYVGVGKGNRMHDHVRRAHALLRQYPTNAKCRFVADCIDRGFVPQPYKIADNLTAENAAEIEVAIIRQIGRFDLGKGPLLNACDGGHGIKNFSDATRALISERTRAAMASPALRQRLSERAKAKFENADARERVAEQVRRQWQSDDGRAKFAAKAKTRWTPELRARQAELTRQQIAKRLSSEVRAEA